MGPTRAWCRDQGASFSLACWFAVLRAANAVPAFRMRLRDGRVYLHDRVRVGATALKPDQSFTYVYFPDAPDFEAFSIRAKAELAERLQAEGLEPDSGDDDLLHCTVVPWVRFTGIKHARFGNPADSIPKIALGKATDVGGARAHAGQRGGSPRAHRRHPRRAVLRSSGGRPGRSRGDLRLVRHPEVPLGFPAVQVIQPRRPRLEEYSTYPTSLRASGWAAWAVENPGGTSGWRYLALLLVILPVVYEGRQQAQIAEEVPGQLAVGLLLEVVPELLLSAAMKLIANPPVRAATSGQISQCAVELAAVRKASQEVAQSPPVPSGWISA